MLKRLRDHLRWVKLIIKSAFDQNEQFQRKFGRIMPLELSYDLGALTMNGWDVNIEFDKTGDKWGEWKITAVREPWSLSYRVVINGELTCLCAFREVNDAGGFSIPVQVNRPVMRGFAAKSDKELHEVFDAAKELGKNA